MMRHHTAPCARVYTAFELLAVALFVCCGALRSGRAEGLQVKNANGVTRIIHDGKLVLEYQAQPHPYKVYVSKLNTPAGVQILRDSPHDHVHHHALMYAIGIDKVDFWAEFGSDKNGKQIPRQTTAQSVSQNGESEASVKQSIDWVTPSGETLACEARTVTAHVGVVPDATLVSWTTTMQPAPGRQSAELWGRHYFGLGMRFVVPMDRGGEFFNPTKKAGDTVRGSEKLVRADWCAYTAQVDGKQVTVAMFDDPGNPRHPATWFTMTTPFAYLSATLELDEKPLTITAAKPLLVHYGIALWDGRIDADTVRLAYDKWVALQHASR